MAGKVDVSSPRWSPSGDRLAYVTRIGGKAQIVVRWMDSGETAPVTRLTEAPRNLAWSPDGRTLAFTMFVPKPSKPLVTPPRKPKGAKWAKPPKVIDQLQYRADGAGYLRTGFTHLFVVPAHGGTARKLTHDDFHHGGRPAWTPDGKTLIVSADRSPNWAYQPLESNLFAVEVATGELTPLTSRAGPEQAPAVSPNGRTIAFLGFEDRKLGFHTNRLHLLDRKTGRMSVLLPELDRSIRRFAWASDGRGLYVQYDDHGNSKLAYTRPVEPAHRARGRRRRHDHRASVRERCVLRGQFRCLRVHADPSGPPGGCRSWAATSSSDLDSSVDEAERRPVRP